MFRKLLVLICLLYSFHAQAFTLKIATLAPDGTGWMKAMRSAAGEIDSQTQGRVKMRFYPGGVMGNDNSVLRKIRVGQLHGGALTTGGLAMISSDTEIYSLPLLFRSQEEVDYLRSRMDEVMLEKLEAKGYVGYGLGETGFVYIMSQAPITGLEELRHQKVWSPEGDSVSQTAFQALDITPIPLPLTDVLTGLQTGLINTVAGSPVGAIALQWHTRVKYLTDTPLLYLYSALVIHQRALKKISQQDRNTLRDILEQTTTNLDTQIRTDNRSALQALQNQGLEFVRPAPADLQQWRVIVNNAVDEMGRKGTISTSLLQQVRKHLAEFRNSQ